MTDDENPYKASAVTNDAKVADHRSDADHRFRRWFVITLAVMVGVNLLPLYFTWRAVELDGDRCVGWPFSFLEYGGQGGGRGFDLHHLIVDEVVAVGLAFLVACALRDGWLAFFDRIASAGSGRMRRGGHKGGGGRVPRPKKL